MWQDDAPVMYVVITISAFGFFCAAFVFSLRRQPHRLQRVRRFLCCKKAPLANYTSVPETEAEMSRFVIVDEDEDEHMEDVEIDLSMSPKSNRTESPDDTHAATV